MHTQQASDPSTRRLAYSTTCKMSGNANKEMKEANLKLLTHNSKLTLTGLLHKLAERLPSSFGTTHIGRVRDNR